MDWNTPMKLFIKHGIPMAVIKNMVDTMLSFIYKKPMFDIYILDDYIHNEYGNYEDEGKSMREMVNKIFGDDAEKIEEYFLIK